MAIFLARMPVGAERGLRIRRGAPLLLMPAAAFTVHQLRFLLAFGGHAGAQLQAQGHSYLHSLVPWLILLVALSAGAFLRALGRSLSGHCSLPEFALSFLALWLLCAASLLAIYIAQEFLEGLLAVGHPGGLAGIFGYGGWWSVPAALAVGLVLAAGFHGARWVLREVAARSLRRPVERRPRPVVGARADVLLPRLAPLAEGWSGRGPPWRH
jgi:hypothetical protein